MVTKKENIASKATFIILLVLVIFVAFKVAASFLVALVVGALLALALRPLQKKLTTKKISPKLSAYLVFLMLIIVVVVPIGFFIKSLVEQAVTFKDYVSMSDLSYSSFFETIGKWPIIGSFISDPAQADSQVKLLIFKLVTSISTFALNQAAQIPLLLFQTFFALLGCLFFLLDGEKFVKFLSDKISMRNDIRKALITSFNKTSRSAIWSTLLAAVSQAVVIFLGFIALNVPAAFLAAGATFIFSFIPVLGALPAWILATIYLYLQGSITKAFLMVAVGIFAGLIDNVVRMVVLKGVKASKGLHPLVSLVAVLGGIKVFGLFGVLIGPVIVALLISMLEVWPSVYNKSNL